LRASRVLLLDCRYAFEYAGGHIRGASNVQFPVGTMDLTLNAPQTAADWLHTVVICYCEFSSERAPRAFRYIRNADRTQHLEAYPQLHIPHMYVLRGGYKAFVSQYPELCVPMGGYVRMVDQRFANELKRCHSTLIAKWLHQGARQKIAAVRDLPPPSLAATLMHE